MTRRVRVAGLLAALGYLAVLLLTRVALPGGARPLYDGFAPPAPYRWVNPPAALRAGNAAPSGGSGTASRSDGPDASLAFETADSQASLTGDLGALGLVAGENGAKGTLTPLDPTTLGALPDGLGPGGNAYRVDVVAQPSGRAITTFAAPVSMSLRIASSAGTTMLASRDGTAWTTVRSTVGEPFVVANTTATGYYVLAGPAGLLPSVEPASKPTGSGPPLGLIAGGILAVAVALAVAALLRRKAG
jgi:hypothetical protein